MLLTAFKLVSKTATIITVATTGYTAYKKGKKIYTAYKKTKQIKDKVTQISDNVKKAIKK